MLKRLGGALLSLSLLTACSDAPGPQQTLETTIRGANAATLSSDANFALVAAVDHGGSLWDLSSGERLFDWNHQQGGYTTLNHTRFSKDNRLAVTASPFDLVLWSIETGEPQWYWKTPDEIDDIDLVSDGRYALARVSALWGLTGFGTVSIVRNHPTEPPNRSHPYHHQRQ